MSDQSIQIIIGHEPRDEELHPIFYRVGLPHGCEHTPPVDCIAYREQNFGDHGLGWFDVFADGKLVVSIAARAIAEVSYVDVN